MENLTKTAEINVDHMVNNGLNDMISGLNLDDKLEFINKANLLFANALMHARNARQSNIEHARKEIEMIERGLTDLHKFEDELNSKPAEVTGTIHGD